MRCTLSDNMLFFLKKPTTLAFVPLAIILFISFIITWPVYQSQDDGWIMRGLADGTLLPSLGKSPYLLFSSVIYGYFLHFFYVHFPNHYWYDIFFYIFLALSIYIISYVLLSSVKIDKKLRYNFAVIIAIPFLFVFQFTRINFTLVCGALSISAVLLYFDSLVRADRGLSAILKFIYIFAAILFAFMIRWDACLACSLFSAASLVFYLKNKKKSNPSPKKLFFVYSLFSFLLVVTCTAEKYFEIYFVQHNQEWNFLSEFNKIRATIHDQTMYEDNLADPILVFANKLSSINDVEKGYYSLLLSWNYLGEQNFFNLKNLKHFSNKIKEDVNISCNKEIKFLLGDYVHLFGKLLMAFLSILFFLRINFNLPLLIFNSVLFIFTISGLNLFFRAIPDRLWYNFTTCFFIAFFIYTKSESKFSFFEKFNIKIPKFISNNIYINLASCFFLLFSFQQLANKNLRANRNILECYNYYSKNLDALDKQNVYLLNYYSADQTVIPFRENIMKKINLKYIILSPISDIYQQKNIRDYYGISADDTWLNIIKNNKFKYLILKKTFLTDYYTKSWVNSLTIFLKAKYGIEFGLEFEDHPLFTVITCKILTNEEMQTRKRFIGILDFFKNYDTINYNDQINIDRENFKNILLKKLVHDYEGAYQNDTIGSLKKIISTIPAVETAKQIINFPEYMPNETFVKNPQR